MKKQYFVWKAPNCNGINPEWLEMTPREFYLFRKEPQNRTRLFVTLDDGGCDEAGLLIMEASKERYDEWRKEYRAAKRRQNQNKAFNYVITSLDELVDNDEMVALHELVPAPDVDVELEALKALDLEQLHGFLTALTPEERRIIDALYLCNQDELSERKIAKQLGMAVMTLNDAKKRIFKKYKK